MSAAPRIGLIWAEAEGRVIGRDGGMPWHVPEDLAHFKQLTLGAPVVMGRGTWDSLTPRYRPLPGRRNIVITRQSDWSADGAERADSVAQALASAQTGGTEWVWVIGGGTIFDLTIAHADRLEVTQLALSADFSPAQGDVRAPQVDRETFALTAADPPVGQYTSGTGIRYRFLRYDRQATARADDRDRTSR